MTAPCSSDPTPREPTAPVQIFIGVGSNIAPERNLPAALQALLARPEQITVEALSTVYITEPIGRPEQPRYRNAVWRARTDLPADRLVAAFKETEASLGRTRSADRFASRTIDLDLLLYGAERLPWLGVPSPDIAERAFVARPLAELAPGIHVEHPAGGQERVERLATRLEREQGPLRADLALSQILKQLLAHLRSSL